MQVDPKASFTPRRFGKYLLLDRIGRGGMAEVYRSKTFGTAGFVKECAIKKILATLLDDEQFVSMFVDEAKLTAYLTHPNIVQVLDLGDIDGHLFIAMEYVSGKDLLDVLARSARRGTRLPIEITLYIVTEMLKGLDFAHGAVDALGKPMHIVHRDVSPSNILLSYDGQVKVGDFGIAKSQMQSSHTEVGTQKGKTGYMSPEQVTGSLIDRRSDVFAATVILFEMLTMTRLFKAPNDLDVMLKIRDADIEEDLERVGRISEGLEQIIRRGLKRRPDERFQTAGDLLDALRDYAVENRIKLSAAPLAAYLAELFADKIEAERERRTLDPADDHGFGVVASANQAAYRYRDREGVIHGPMRVGLMEELLASRVPNDIEAIALGAADWKSVAAFAEFADVPRPRPARHSSTTRAEWARAQPGQTGRTCRSPASTCARLAGACASAAPPGPESGARAVGSRPAARCATEQAGNARERCDRVDRFADHSRPPNHQRRPVCSSARRSGRENRARPTGRKDADRCVHLAPAGDRA
ncbi:MAG: protein kinase [Myxococcales bacterium]|nr:protein kinase [Myxococcales bacterium]